MGGLVVLLAFAMAPKRRPEELLCFFGTKAPGRRRAIAHCHSRGDFTARRRWMSLDVIVEGTIGVLEGLTLEERALEAFEAD